ncbi:MAG TPA: hypothetical protein VEC01_14920 [Noviherbaspirillum sp.]|uniref:hypothetical protein n=1 Tax=Noviherbaspirillum sp. TaxID=1926288 RepID=UPI002D760AF4|nr:hypothetical protein [Noviherbaspirillum sp.]HYD96620.1 hypothetical protein [Noviherbaspirillum sp.]
MLKWIARRRLAAFEREFDYDASYLHRMLDVSWQGFLRFAPMMKLAAHREDVPPAAWYAAKIVVSLAEDCGPCTQLGVTMAEREGVPQPVLRGILAGDEKAMGSDAALAARFARATLAHDPAADVWREQIVQRWGERALLSLALAIAAVRVFPTVKYALGHGKACSRIRVGNMETRPAPSAAPA